jgi:hypothetical protein
MNWMEIKVNDFLQQLEDFIYAIEIDGTPFLPSYPN